ncbi:MAG: hypothetical protein M1602_07015 [Firmicutes bacterium]|nr:hypothetical protein [Bacillota bacterium]
MRKLLVVAIVLAALLAALFAAQLVYLRPGGTWRVPPPNPEREVHRRYLLWTQLPSGAFATEPSRTRIVPYFANYAAAALLESRQDRPQVRRYILWYLEHLNRPDRWGFSGTVDDFAVLWSGDGTRFSEVPLNSYDSADAYAATFLSLVRAYFEATGDWQLYWERVEQFDAVAELLLRLQDSDGLFVVSPSSGGKYLMDNSVSYRGLVDWPAFQELAGRREKAARFRQAADALARGFRDWPREPTCLAWAIHPGGKAKQSNPERWYPDGVAQLYPGLFGLRPPQSVEAQKAYEELNRSFPGWPDLDTPDTYPWTMVAYAAAGLGDRERVDRFRQAVSRQYPQLQFPWYSLESALYLRLLARPSARLLLPQWLR